MIVRLCVFLDVCRKLLHVHMHVGLHQKESSLHQSLARTQPFFSTLGAVCESPADTQKMHGSEWRPMGVDVVGHPRQHQAVHVVKCVVAQADR